MAYADEELSKFKIVESGEETDLTTKIEYVKAYQKFRNAFEALNTYDKYNEEFYSTDLQEKTYILEEQNGVYETIKGSIKPIVEDGSPEDEIEGLNEIEFYGNNQAKLYDGIQDILINYLILILRIIRV